MVARGNLSQDNLNDLEDILLENPKTGSVIPGMGGLRKIRMKGTNIGKRGGFRVDYLDIPDVYKLHFIALYKKNIKEDLSSEEKRFLREFVEMLKEEEKNNGRNV